MAKKSSLDVAGKTFRFEPDTESELEAFMAAKRHLRALHAAAVKRILPAPGSQRKAERTYDQKTGLPLVVKRTERRKAARVSKKTRSSGNVVLSPAPAILKAKGN